VNTQTDTPRTTGEKGGRGNGEVAIIKTITPNDDRGEVKRSASCGNNGKQGEKKVPRQPGYVVAKKKTAKCKGGQTQDTGSLFWSNRGTLGGKSTPTGAHGATETKRKPGLGEKGTSKPKIEVTNAAWRVSFTPTPLGENRRVLDGHKVKTRGN